VDQAVKPGFFHPTRTFRYKSDTSLILVIRSDFTNNLGYICLILISTLHLLTCTMSASLLAIRPQNEACLFCLPLTQERPQTSGPEFVLYTHTSLVQGVLNAAKSGCRGCQVLLFAMDPFVEDWHDKSATVSILRTYYGQVLCKVSGKSSTGIRVEIYRVKTSLLGACSLSFSLMCFGPSDSCCSSYILTTFLADRELSFVAHGFGASDNDGLLVAAYMCC
jgi:hypothetical protein